jgi:hypothetical protein
VSIRVNLCLLVTSLYGNRGVSSQKNFGPTTRLRPAVADRLFRLRSGQSAVIDVPTRDHAFLNSTGRLVVVFTDNDGARVLDVALVTAIDYEKAPEDLGQ